MQLRGSRRSFLKYAAAWLTTLLPIKTSAAAPETGRTGHFALTCGGDMPAAPFPECSAIDSPRVRLTAPEIAEDGAAVPVTVDCDLHGVSHLYLIADDNPTPLVAAFEFTDGIPAYVSTRIRMAQTGRLRAIAMVNGEPLQAGCRIQVMKGGCGTG